MARHHKDWIEAFLKYTERSESPIIYRRWVAVSVIASLLQRKCFIEWEKTKYPNMYIVLVGPSGKCRKGDAMGPGMELLRSIGINLAAEAITREALIRELDGVSYEHTYIDKEGNNRIAIHSSLTIYSQELTVFLGYNNPQLLSDLTDWYDCRDVWIYRTKNMGTDEINGVYVNLIGATTPELIQSALPLDAVGGGLASRIIFVYAGSKGKKTVFPFLEKPNKSLKGSLSDDMEEIALMSGEFTMSPTAMKLYEPWYLNQEGGALARDNRFSGYLERRPNHVIKLSMLLSASRRTDMVITEDVLKDAISLLSKTEKQMPKALKGLGRSDLALLTETVRDIVHDEKKIRMSVLQTMLYRDASKEILAKAIATLQVMGEIRLDLIEGKGKKKQLEISYIGKEK